MGGNDEGDEEAQMASDKKHHRGATCSTGNMGNNMVISMCGVGWTLDLPRRSLHRYINVVSLVVHLDLI